MRILQINSVCGVGSTGKIVLDIHRLLEEKGYVSVIGFGRGKAPNDIKSIKIGKKIDNYYHFFQSRVFDNHGFASKRATKSFIEKVKIYDPDIIHLHNIHGYYINIEILFNYLKECNKPVIWTLHDCWSFTGHCSYFEYSGCNGWKKDCSKCIQKKEYPSSLFFSNSKVNYLRKRENFTGIKKMTIVTPSKWLSDLVKQSYLKEYKVYVINNGIDTNKFKFRENDFRKINNLDDKIILLGVASIWDRRKGLEYFEKLSKKLDNRYKIVLVGVNEKQKRTLSKDILAISKTNNQEELANIYSAADIFINPTLEDNYPTTNLEALSCKTKVITFNSGGSGETVKNSSSLVLNKKTTEELYKGIMEFSKKDISFYSNEKYDKSILFEKYIDLYEKVYRESN